MHEEWASGIRSGRLKMNWIRRAALSLLVFSSAACTSVRPIPLEEISFQRGNEEVEMDWGFSPVQRKVLIPPPPTKEKESEKQASVAKSR